MMPHAIKYIALLFCCFISWNSSANDAKTDSLAQMPYAINQISAETEKTQRFLRDVSVQLNSSENKALLDSIKLAKVEKANKVNQYLDGDNFNKLEARQIENLQGILTKEYDELNKMRQAMSNKTALFDSQLKQARLQRNRWGKTLKSDSLNELSQNIISRIEQNTGMLDSSIVMLSSFNKELLYQQDEITNGIWVIEDLQTKLKNKLNDYRTNLYDSNNLPIWKLHTLGSDSISVTENIKSSLRAKQYALKAYRNSYNHLFLFWFISSLVIAIILLRIRHNFARRNKAGKTTSHNNETPYPIITAIFLGTLLTILNYPNAPTLILSILQLSLFIPTLTLLPALWTRLPYRYFVFAVGTVLIVVLTDTLNDLAIVNRALMLFNSISLISIYITLFDWLKNHDRIQRSIPLNNTMLVVGITSIIFSLICNIIGNSYLMSVFFNGSITAIFGGALLYSVRRIINNNIDLIVEDKILGKLHIFEENSTIIIQTSHKIVHSLCVIFWFILTAKSLVVFDPIYDWVKTILDKPWELGSMSISLGNILAFVITFIFTIYISRFIRFILEGEVFIRTHTSRGVAGVILMLVRLSLVAVGIILAMGAADIDVSNITIIFGALGVGIGFGLQTIFNNLASGIILAFERPIKAGDMIQIHSLDLWGEVKEIGIRASTISTFDGADVIVPNGNLLANEVINWTHSNQRRRQEVFVGVAYGTDLNMVCDILTKVINSQSGVIKHPEPYVIFTGFGESSLDFSIRFWTHFNDGLIIKSAVGIAIDNAFKAAGVEIPFPQRDLHIIQKGDSSVKVKYQSTLANLQEEGKLKMENNEFKQE